MAESATSVGSFAFFGLFAMVSLSPRYLYASGAVAIVPHSREAGNMPVNGPKARRRALVRIIQKTSYWQSDTNEMAAIKTILIIVNS